MTLSRGLIVSGAFLLLIGLYAALKSNRDTALLMGGARFGVAVLAPSENDKAAWAEKQRLLANADFWFDIGLGLTAAGIILQVIGSYLPPEKRRAS